MKRSYTPPGDLVSDLVPGSIYVFNGKIIMVLSAPQKIDNPNGANFALELFEWLELDSEGRIQRTTDYANSPVSNKFVLQRS